MRHFLRDDDVTPAEQADILARAAAMKADRFAAKPLAGPHTVALIFDKPTLRTQASFSVGINDLGGVAMVVDGALAQIGKRESVADVARVLGRQASVIVWRTFAQTDLEQMAAQAGVPVINALTDEFHPCQLLADLMTIAEHRGGLAGQRLAFLGDGANNMSHSTLLAGALAGMHIVISAPAQYAPDPAVLARAEELAATTGGSVAFEPDPMTAVVGCDVVVTDTWVSMGREDEASAREAPFLPYQLNAALLAAAKPDAIVLHCLPAYRGKEITAEVLDGPQSVVWDQAENRRHAQKAIIEFLMERRGGGPLR